MEILDDVNLEAVNAGIWLRSFKGCEHYTDDQALGIVRTLDTLAEVMFENTVQRLEKEGKIKNCSLEKDSE